MSTLVAICERRQMLARRGGRERPADLNTMFRRAFITMMGFMAQSLNAQTVIGDEHILLCHVDFLRFYRVRLIEKNQHGVECKSWAGWRLINDAPADEKEQYKADMKFYRANNIEIQFAAVEGKLPA